MAGIDINAAALVKLERKLTAFRIVDLKIVQAPILAAVQAQVEANFSSQSDGSEAWRRLAPATQKDRKRRGYGPASPILVRTGALKAAATTQLKAKVDGPVLSVNVGGSRAIQRIAQYHSSGTKKIPARPFLKVTASLSAAIADIVAGAQFQSTNEQLAAD